MESDVVDPRKYVGPKVLTALLRTGVAFCFWDGSVSRKKFKDLYILSG